MTKPTQKIDFIIEELVSGETDQVIIDFQDGSIKRSIKETQPAINVQAGQFGM